MSGFTLALCRGRGCVPDGGRGPVDEALARATRRSEHGVLVVTGCLLGPMLCRACGPSASSAARSEAPAVRAEAGSAPVKAEPVAEQRVAVVQPCDPARRPSGRSVLVGPIRGTQDAARLCRWLGSSELDAADLPAHLRGYADLLRRAPAN